jgi:hypothetical protein
MNLRQFMVNGGLVDGLSFRKDGGELNVNKSAIEMIGGVDVMAQRLISLWLELDDYYRTMGSNWYDDAHNFAWRLSDIYDLSIWQVAQVIAVLSPQNPWDGKVKKDGSKGKSDGNKICAVKVIDAWHRGGEVVVMALKGWGYAPDFLAKAVKVLKGEELDWSTAPKTHRFALLIANPKRLDIAVMDSHASRIATGNLSGRYHVVAASAYLLLESAYMQAAAVLGIPAYVLQAGIWQAAADGLLY